jgi:hypothetical protein
MEEHLTLLRTQLAAAAAADAVALGTLGTEPSSSPQAAPALAGGYFAPPVGASAVEESVRVSTEAASAPHDGGETPPLQAPSEE